ncbi:MAG: hypothetical protein VKP62_09430 [Candidatus Sericytochromatia bacterium]|nr:hypothetical protein [Candidatus Sericytochromatia bacterium]
MSLSRAWLPRGLYRGGAALALMLLLAGGVLPPARAADLPTAATQPTPEVPAFDPNAMAIRGQQLQLHQGLALGTLGAMAATAGLGWWRARGGAAGEWRDVHLAMAGLTTGLYLATGTLAFTTPPQTLYPEDNPWSSANLHRNLAWVHGAGMLTTVGLGLTSAIVGGDVVARHGVAAWSTLSLMALSAGLVAFGQ